VSMAIGAILSLAFGLSMDAVAASASQGLAAERVRVRDAVAVAACFGGFQALMPVLGATLGAVLGPLVRSYGHAAAALLLATIGAKMVWEARAGHADHAPSRGRAFSPRALVVLGIATSLDAFAAGLSLPLLGAPLGLSVLIIGLTTALLSALAAYAGRHFGHLLGKRLDALGGGILVLLALHIVLGEVGHP
jgi:putative Mn2+ efflux pump MntP